MVVISKKIIGYLLGSAPNIKVSEYMCDKPFFATLDNVGLWEKLRVYLDKPHPCLVCDHDQFDLWAKEGYLEALKCRACGMISVNPHFTDAGLDLFYRDYFQYRQEDLLRKQQRDQAYILDRDWINLFIQGGDLLDIGCSGGFFLNTFSSEHWNRHGVEMGQSAADFGLKNFGIPIMVGNLVEMDIQQRFDLVMLRGVIEHVRDPIPYLEKCISLLKPGGLLFITATPAGDAFAFDVYREKWVLFTPLEHIHFFSHSLLVKVLSRFGMHPLAHHYPYEETPYANPESDFSKIRADIVHIHQGKNDHVQGSVPFPGSMLTAVWKKEG